ncbi:MAG: sporulation protein YqfD [Bacillus sp. (in: Bacteria)]|nr:sporulation protein YqfD [Bacillus sp. (in: firmicutes)]
MKNQWVTFFQGTVLVRARGVGVERFVNRLMNAQIALWNIKRQGTDTITFYVMLKDIHKLRRYVRKEPIRLSFLRGVGMPFLWKRVMKNSGFFVGIILFLGAVFLLSNMVWGIEIKGASPELEHKIEKQLKEMGITKGKLRFYIDDVQTIQRKLTNELKEVTWIGVQLKGTTYHFEVVEKNTPPPVEYIGPQNLIAKKNGVIVQLFIENGQPLVSVHEYVAKGQILVQGVIGKGEFSKVVPAKGEVWAETWYKTDVELPLTSQFTVMTGNSHKTHRLSFGSFSIPIWGFESPEFTNVQKETNQYPLHFLGWKLPISYSKEVVWETEEVERTYSKEEALEAAIAIGRDNLIKTLPEGARIKGEKVLQQRIENGKVKVSIYFQVIENIAEAQPIIQGDVE